jgi:hypothetical protein
MNTVLNRKLGQKPDLAEFMTTKEAVEKMGFHVKRIPTMVRNKTIVGIDLGVLGLSSRNPRKSILKKQAA